MTGEMCVWTVWVNASSNPYDLQLVNNYSSETITTYAINQAVWQSWIVPQQVANRAPRAVA